MSPLETTLVVAVGILLVVWIVMLAAVLFIVWRLRKTIMAVTFAVRGMKALSRQVSELSRNVNSIKGRIQKRTG